MTTYKFKTTPYRHQREAFKQLWRQGYGGALIMEPRTGKTKTTIDWLSALSLTGRIRKAVIVCPNRVMGTWLRELYMHSPRLVHVTVWDKDARKQGAPPEPSGFQLYMIIVNYDAFGVPGAKLASGRRSKASGRFKTRKLIMDWLGADTAACVLDESHKIKSAAGKAANMIVTMGPRFAYRAILTGTPLTKANRAHDIYMQWRFLNPNRFSDLPTQADFKAHYGRWVKTDSGWMKYKGPKNMAELHARIRQDAFVVRRDECFDLPPLEHLVEYVELGPSARVYKDMAEKMVAEIEEGVYAEASIPLVKALRLSQITSGFVTTDEGDVRRVGFEKYERLIELLAERFEQDQKVVVVARWRADLDLIEAYGHEHKVSTWSIRGRVKRADSDRAIDEFRDAEGAGLMVVQPSAASLGIDLSTASHMVWYSHTPSWVDFTQCCDRIALSRTSTTFTHLVARSSIDEVLLSTLAGDGDVARAIMSKPGELVNGRPLNLDDHSRLVGIGSFQYASTKENK